MLSSSKIPTLLQDSQCTQISVLHVRSEICVYQSFSLTNPWRMTLLIILHLSWECFWPSMHLLLVCDQPQDLKTKPPFSKINQNTSVYRRNRRQEDIIKLIYLTNHFYYRFSSKWNFNEYIYFLSTLAYKTYLCSKEVFLIQ